MGSVRLSWRANDVGEVSKSDRRDADVVGIHARVLDREIERVISFLWHDVTRFTCNSDRVSRLISSTWEQVVLIEEIESWRSGVSRIERNDDVSSRIRDGVGIGNRAPAWAGSRHRKDVLLSVVSDCVLLVLISRHSNSTGSVTRIDNSHHNWRICSHLVTWIVGVVGFEADVVSALL